MTVGLPRSGKSTWAKSQALPIINPDSFRLAIHGKRFDPDMENQVWYHVKIAAKAALMCHDTIIVDATNVNGAQRRFWKGMADVIEYKEFRTDKEECIRRAIETGQEDLVPIIERMSTKLTWPTECI